MYYKSTKFYKIVEAVFQKTKILNFFLMWTTLHFEGRSKTKRDTGNICKGTPDIEFWQDWTVGLGATLRERQKIKNYFSSFKDFSGESRCWASNVLINTQNLNKIVRAIFEKIDFFFLCELPLILGLGRKIKKTTRDICKRNLHIEFERDRSIGLGSTIGEGQTDRHRHTHTHTHTFFLKHIFRLLEWCRITHF